MGWQWHQLDHMQIICTLFQTDNQASTSSLSFYRPDGLPATQPTASKALKAQENNKIYLEKSYIIQYSTILFKCSIRKVN